MVTENSLLDITEDITDYTLMIFLSIAKSSIVTKLPNAIQDRFDKETGQSRSFWAGWSPLKEENRSTRGEEITKERGDRRRKIRLHFFSTGTIKKTLFNCFFSRAVGTFIRINIAPMF